MAYKNYVNKFYSQRGNRYDLEIWSKSDSSLSSVEFATGKGGFKLSYKGGNDRQDIIMPSEVTIPFIVSNADDQTFINGLLSADDKEYFLVIKRNFVLFWWGNLNAGFDSKPNNYYPYISTLKANDFLGEIMNDKEYTSITSLQSSLSENTIKQFVDISEIDEWDQDVFPFGADELIFKTNLDWTAPNQLSYNDQNSVFNQFFINPQGFQGSSNFINKYKKSDTFKEVLRAFGLKMFLADGKVYCLQPYNYVNNNFLFQNFKTGNTSTYFPVDFDTLDNRQNAENDAQAATDSQDGFQFEQWILEPAAFNDASQNWQANGSCTSISAKSFNVALVTSNLYIDLAEGEYCVSYSENDASVYIAKEEGGTVTSLLTESGQTNFSIGAGGGELRVYTSVVGTLTIDNLALQKGKFAHRTFLAGHAFRYDRPIGTATATFPYGNSGAQAISNFPNINDTNTTDSIYTSLTSIGAISASDAEQVQMRLNVFYGERFDYLSAANNITHIGGSLELKFKIGTLYLTGTTSNLSWTAVDSTFTIPISIAALAGNYNDSFWFQTIEPVCQSFLPNASEGYYFGAGNGGSMGFVGVNTNVTLPTLTAGGDVQLQFVSGTINYYTNPDTSNPNVAPTPVTLTKNNLITKWFTGSAYSSSIAGTPTPLKIYTFDQDNVSSGIEFSASTGVNNYQTINLGNIRLGTSGDETAYMNAIKVLASGPSYEVPNYLQVNNTGTQYNMTTLLLKQYIEPQTNPLEIIDGEYYVNDFSAFKSVVLDGNKYVFFEGTFNAENDVVSGSWYKMSESSETITTTEEDVIFIEDDSNNEVDDDTGNPHDDFDNNDNIIIIHQHYDLLDHIIKDDTKQKGFVQYNSIGLSSSAISAASTSVNLINNSRAKLYDGQKLIFSWPDLSHAVILTKAGDSTTSVTKIDVASFTPDVTYPAGSILSIAQYDLTNVITGGSSTPNLYKGVTTTAIYIRPDEFVVPSSSSFSMYSRDEMASVQPSSYVNRSHVYATSFVPLNYKVTAVDIYMDQNRGFTIFEGRHDTSGTTSLDTGTANTTLTLSSAWTSVEGKYLILEINFGGTDKIYGAKLTIEAV